MKLNSWEERRCLVNKQPDSAWHGCPCDQMDILPVFGFKMDSIYNRCLWFLSSYNMLSSWPLTEPLSGKRPSTLLMVLSCCFLSWSSWLCSKSVEADRGSPSLTRTTKANRIRDMILWVHEEHTVCMGWRSDHKDYHIRVVTALFSEINNSFLEYLIHVCP